MSPARQQPLPGRSREMHALERKLAYEHCCAVLNAYFNGSGSRDKDFHLGQINPPDEIAQELIDEAVRYLEWRGLLVRDSKDPQLVTVLEDDSEVTA